MTKEQLLDLITDNLTEYDNVEEYCSYNNVDPDDFKDWISNGGSEDGVVQVWDCIAVGSALTGFKPITNMQQVADLIKEEIKNGDFEDLVECFNEDNEDSQIDLMDQKQMIETFMDSVKVSTVKTEKGLILVIDYD